jgi:hypothetical protein
MVAVKRGLTPIDAMKILFILDTFNWKTNMAQLETLVCTHQQVPSSSQTTGSLW